MTSIVERTIAILEQEIVDAQAIVAQLRQLNSDSAVRSPAKPVKATKASKPSAPASGRPTWTPERKKKFMETMAARRTAKTAPNGSPRKSKSNAQAVQ